MADLSPVCGSEQGGVRPVIVIQNNTGNQYSPDFDCGCCHGSKSEEGRSADPLSAPE